MKRTILAIAAAAALWPGMAVADTSAAKDLDPALVAAAERLLEATKVAEVAEDLFEQQIAEVMGHLQRGQPEMPGRAFDIIEEELEATTPEVIEEMMAVSVEMYVERFTAAEMDEIAAFYLTPVGAKALRELRSLSHSGARKGNEIGQRLGREAAQRAFARIKAEGLDVRR